MAISRIWELSYVDVPTISAMGSSRLPRRHLKYELTTVLCIVNCMYYGFYGLSLNRLSNSAHAQLRHYSLQLVTAVLIVVARSAGSQRGLRGGAVHGSGAGGQWRMARGRSP
eukprot:2738695-Pleurochrysis_carterae.AAC.2